MVLAVALIREYPEIRRAKNLIRFEHSKACSIQSHEPSLIFDPSLGLLTHQVLQLIWRLHSVDPHCSTRGASASYTTVGSKLRGLRLASMTNCVSYDGSIHMPVVRVRSDMIAGMT